jgi:glutamyl aminopeptidase
MEETIMITDQQRKRLEHLTQLHGISGDERTVAQALSAYYAPYADRIDYDGLGSIVALKKSRRPKAQRVLLMGHMDEVGFVVKTITATGLLKIAPIGGWWSQTLLGQRVLVKSESGALLPGAIGSVPPHNLSDAERAKVMSIEHMLVDVGCSSAEAVRALGINVGSPIVLDGPFHVLNKGERLLAKAFDNRYGCALGVDLLEALDGVDLPFDLYVGASVQEEVGIRGAETLSYKVHPDLAIVFDCSPANDANGDTEAFGKLGAGPLVRFIDRNFLPHRGFINHFVDVLQRNQIPHQYYQSMGGTDAGAVHKQFDGVPTLTLCICARYIHTNSSIIDVNDYSNALKAALAVLQSLNDDTIEAIKKANQ